MKLKHSWPAQRKCSMLDLNIELACGSQSIGHCHTMELEVGFVNNLYKSRKGLTGFIKQQLRIVKLAKSLRLKSFGAQALDK